MWCGADTKCGPGTRQKADSPKVRFGRTGLKDLWHTLINLTFIPKRKESRGHLLLTVVARINLVLRVFLKEASPTTMINDTQGGVGSGGFDQGMAGDNQLTMSNMIKEFQGLKDKFKNEDEDECEFQVSSVLCLSVRCLDGAASFVLCPTIKKKGALLPPTCDAPCPMVPSCSRHRYFMCSTYARCRALQ